MSSMSKLVIGQGLTSDEDVGDSNNLVGEMIFSNTFKHRKNDHIIIMILDKRNLKFFFFYFNFKFKTKLQSTRYKKKEKENKRTKNHYRNLRKHTRKKNHRQTHRRILWL